MEDTDFKNLTGESHTIVTANLKEEWQVILLAIIIGVIIAITVLGNLLVIITVISQRRLHSPTNFLILSLAICDLCLGCFVLPFSAVVTLHTEWPLGWIFCNIYISLDVMLCTVSILTLFAISLDRYYAVTKPLKYQGTISSKKIFKTSAVIWIFSFLLAYVPIFFGWNAEEFGKVQNRDNPTVCKFQLNKCYVLIVSLGTYFAPLIIMCVVYARVLCITKKQVQEINKLNSAGFKALSTADQKSKVKFASDTKATITLFLLVLAFAICWIPYFSVFTSKPFLNYEVNATLELVFLWLGYINSTINPFLYAYYNKAFREAFTMILCPMCASRQSSTFRVINRPTCYSENNELTNLNGKHTAL